MKKPKPITREHGDCMIHMAHGPDFRRYTVMGRSKVILDFYINDKGERIERRMLPTGTKLLANGIFEYPRKDHWGLAIDQDHHRRRRSNRPKPSR